MKYLIKYKLTLIGVIFGAIAGYVYYVYVGCEGGTCSITSDPTNSTLYGSVLGGFLLNSFQKSQKD